MLPGGVGSKENHTWMIEEKTPEVMKALETIELVEGKPIKVTKVRTNLAISTREKNISFSKENLDVLHEAMRICLAYRQTSSSIIKCES